jgi:hypothetical protein
VVEQDSLEDIFACVRMIVECPRGAWIDSPQFGIPSPLFAQAPVGTAGIQQAIVRQEPRASLLLSEYPDLLSPGARRVRIDVSSAPSDQ